jgi:hypothetical protein
MRVFFSFPKISDVGVESDPASLEYVAITLLTLLLLNRLVDYSKRPGSIPAADSIPIVYGTACCVIPEP